MSGRRWLGIVGLLGGGCSDYQLDQGSDNSAVEPDILVAPLDVHFGVISDGESGLQVLTLTNQGSAELLVANLLLEGDDFLMSSASPPFSIPAEESLTVNLSYTPTSPSSTGALTVLSNDPDTPSLQVPLYGGYEGPKLLIDPPALSFGELMLSCEEEALFSLRNVGTAELNLGDITLPEGGYTLSRAPDRLSLAPGQTTTVGVTFRPTEAALYEAQLAVASNDPTGMQAADLWGVGDVAGACRALELTFAVEHEYADIAFILDTTTSMGSMASAMASEFQDIVTALDAELSDLTFGVAVHRDYAPPVGVSGDLPFILLAQQTTNLTRVQAALSNISLVGGGYDMPEASYEALYQAASGMGYDQSCDGQYDEDEDVLPFKRRSDDAFSGAVSGAYSSAAEGGGDVGGMGFRENILPIIILATDAGQKDADKGGNLPGGCPKDAGASDVRAAMAAIDARLIGIGVQMSSTDLAQLSDIADLTVTWSGGSGIQSTIVSAVEALIRSITFDAVWLEITSDPYAQVDEIDPDRWYGVHAGDEVAFTLTVSSAIAQQEEDSTYPVQVEVYGRIDAESWLLDTHTFYVQRPE